MQTFKKDIAQLHWQKIRMYKNTPMSHISPWKPGLQTQKPVASQRPLIQLPRWHSSINRIRIGNERINVISANTTFAIGQSSYGQRCGRISCQTKEVKITLSKCLYNVTVLHQYCGNIILTLSFWWDATKYNIEN